MKRVACMRTTVEYSSLTVLCGLALVGSGDGGVVLRGELGCLLLAEETLVNGTCTTTSPCRLSGH
jgi:hypothetical protein